MVVSPKTGSSTKNFSIATEIVYSHYENDLNKIVIYFMRKIYSVITVCNFVTVNIQCHRKQHTCPPRLL